MEGLTQEQEERAGVSCSFLYAIKMEHMIVMHVLSNLSEWCNGLQIIRDPYRSPVGVQLTHGLQIGCILFLRAMIGGIYFD